MRFAKNHNLMIKAVGTILGSGGGAKKKFLFTLFFKRIQFCH